MGKPKISRRQFVGTTAIGIGCLAAGSSSRLFASESKSMVPVLQNVWKQAKAYTMEFAEAMPDEKFGSNPPKRSSLLLNNCYILPVGISGFLRASKAKNPLNRKRR